MTLKLPDMLYIQIEDDYGDLLDSVDDIETYSWERVHRTDAVYIRAGKRVPRRAELENLQSALARAISIIHQLEAATETASVTWVGGQPMGVMEREREDRTMNDDSREIDRELFRSALNWINGLEKVASDAITRAENAEDEVTALKAWIAECHENYYELEARIAEMEAGAQWRPASEPPDKDGEYLIYRQPDLKYQPNARPDAAMMDVADYHAGRTNAKGELNEWSHNAILMPITHWRPLPTPPQEAPAP